MYNKEKYVKIKTKILLNKKENLIEIIPEKALNCFKN